MMVHVDDGPLDARRRDAVEDVIDQARPWRRRRGLGSASVRGRMRVPMPAARTIAVLTVLFMALSVLGFKRALARLGGK
jgi:hypothetical protein